MNSDFKKKALYWANQFNVYCFLDSHNYKDQYGQYDWLLAIDEIHSIEAANQNFFEELQDFQLKNPTYMFGFFSYELKNQTENLKSENPDFLGFPLGFFFIPKYLIASKNNKIEIILNTSNIDLISEIQAFVLPETLLFPEPKIESRLSKNQYLERVCKLQEHISRGDVYEVTFCQEFYAANAKINPITTYLNLTDSSPVPFAGLFKLDSKFIISASPERFIQRTGNHVISQPIKGTAPRNSNPLIDEQLKENLRNNPKERAENIMIVDLVRNDLTKIASKATVHVPELCNIYSYPSVHQMISTIACKVEEDTTSSSIIKQCFPMGSMTGAPKIKAMELIEKYEETKRGAYSGSIGYFTPNGNFDFNVVIRSIFYNKDSNYLSFQVGGAITNKSIPELEYEECLLKAKSIFHILKK